MSTARSAVTLTDTIASILRDEILSGQYRPGERLPSERDLSDRFGANRGAVREALRQLQQLGIASIQPGGARVVSIEDCTLDVLAPLLELNEIPDPKLVDEVMHMIGVLMREAATAAAEKATDEELDEARQIIDDILDTASVSPNRFSAFRQLGDFYVRVADHLVLRLMLNGLKTSFVDRMTPHRPMVASDPEGLDHTLRRIQNALAARSKKELGDAMFSLNMMFRKAVRESLQYEIGTAETRKGERLSR